MTTANRRVEANTVIVELVGELDERTEFASLIGEPGSSLVINTSKVTRINSDAVRSWIRYFSSLRYQGVRLAFVACSPVVVGQINQILNFVDRKEIRSVNVPFICTRCKKELRREFTLTEASADALPVLAPSSCPQCGGSAVFDDLPEEYFGFLNRKH